MTLSHVSVLLFDLHDLPVYGMLDVGVDIAHPIPSEVVHYHDYRTRRYTWDGHFEDGPVCYCEEPIYR